MRRWLLIGSLAATLSIGVAAAWAFTPPSDFREPTTLRIEAGDGLKQVVWRLRQQGLIRSADLTYLYARMTMPPVLQPGVYRLAPGGPAALLGNIARGEFEVVRLTIPEGWSIERAAKLAAGRGLDAAAYADSAIHAPALAERYPFLATLPPGRTLEGYLFPDTYDVALGAESRLIGRQLDRFADQVLPVWQKRPANWPLTLDQTVALASIVELEAQVARERPLIAGVFLRRLQIGMPLGSDPTVEYALKRHQGDKGLSYKDVAIESPYNTYRYPGLPPTPIGNPGLASFKATLAPEASPYLYFVARGDGSHVFTRTYAEHLAAGRRIRQGR